MRRPLLMGLAALGAFALYYVRWGERGRVCLDRYTLHLERSGLPRSGVIILHLSDFHFRAADPVQARRLVRLHALLASEHYDILALTGDLIHDVSGLPVAMAFLADLQPVLGAFSVPGNRDYWESSFSVLLGTAEERANLSLIGRVALVVHRARRVARMFLRNERAGLRKQPNDVPAMHTALTAVGVQPLVNRAVQAGALWFAGIDDLTAGQPDLDAALQEVPAGVPLVLLAHNPDAWLDPRADRADLVLSGHTHGGQIRLPIVGALYRQGTHLSRHRAAGWFRRGKTRLFVSRGLGESFLVRFGAPPQAALIRLLPCSEGAGAAKG